MNVRWATRASEGVWSRLLGAALVVGAALAVCRPAWALYLDEDRNISFRLRAYSQASMATQHYEVQSDPQIGVGNFVQHRNFFNPEIDIKLHPYLQEWFGSSFFDEVTLRGAAWGFYDGIYDYLAGEFANRNHQARFHYDAQGNPLPHGAFQTKGYTYNQALSGNGVPRQGLDIYGRRIRANEAYMSLAKGPLFLRIGRQAISWGESDTIALLDANNPFDTTVLPGIMIDVDESRIPLWTLRGTYQLFSNVGPFSSGFLDAYIVPGIIDSTVSALQMQSVSPFSAPPPAGRTGVQEVFQQLPTTQWKSTRWGVRFQTVIARNYTTSLWFYKTFQTTPVPLIIGVSRAVPTHGVVAALQQRLTNVAGIATTFFFEPLNSIIRSEVEVFNNEPAFRVASNIIPGLIGQRATFDKINIIRGELGVDRNIFITALNPTTSFVWVSALVFEANPNFTKFKRYRAAGVLKPSAIEREKNGGLPAGSVTASCDGQNPGHGCDFVGTSDFSMFVQSHIQTDYMHGKLTPALTAIVNTYGGMAIFPEITYRVSDSLILNSRYINIHTFGSQNTGFTGFGLFRDRDEVWLRMTYQLN